jgi:hypothetical protein
MPDGSLLLTPERAARLQRVAAGASIELDRRKRARTNILDFTRYTFHKYQTGHHHRLICEKLDRVESGDLRRLMIFMPPRHGKSELASRRFPPYVLGRNPEREVISASYGSDLALDLSRDARNIVASPEFRALFPGMSLSQDSKAKNRWHTSHGGGYVSAGVGTAITGRGADVFNIDDPVKDRAEAESETTRESVWAWYRSTAYTRLEKDAAIILTMTRWHEDDLAGRLLEAAQVDGDKWEVLCLPAFSPEGDALWPEKYDRDALNQIRRVLELREWGALYEQNPRPSGSSFFDVQYALVGSVIQDNRLAGGVPVEYPTICDAVFAVMDTAVKTGSKNDGTGVAYFSLSNHVGHKVVVLDWDIQQIEGASLEGWLPTIFENLDALALKCRARMGVLGVFVEDKASGTILLQQMRRRQQGADLGSRWRPHWLAHEIDSKLTAVGKDERAISVSGYVTRGDVKISQVAYDKITTYKGRAGNHFLMQVFRFQLGVRDQADDLLDCWCYGIAIALGDWQGY